MSKESVEFNKEATMDILDLASEEYDLMRGIGISESSLYGGTYGRKRRKSNRAKLDIRDAKSDEETQREIESEGQA